MDAELTWLEGSSSVLTGTFSLEISRVGHSALVVRGSPTMSFHVGRWQQNVDVWYADPLV